jgi:hypothetical protein
MDDSLQNEIGPEVAGPKSNERTELNKTNQKQYTHHSESCNGENSSELLPDETPSDNEILEQEEIGRKLLDEGKLFDADEVRRALAVLIEPRAVFEIRALNVPRRGSGKGIISGYFDDIEACIAQLSRLTKAAGVYVTLNSVDTALLARRVNRLDYASSGDTSGDQHIFKRRWLLIDCDAERPSGISSTDAEKEAARQKAREVYAFLKQQGWPSPVASDSGNGFHLLYRIEVPADDGGLIERVLAALAERFNGDGVKIDRTVHNPSRIVRLYGTKACKGDNTPERPHRLSRLVNTPAKVCAVTRKQLEALAAPKGQPQSAPRQPRKENSDDVFNSGWDMAGFLTKHSIAFHGDVRTLPDGRKMWILKECPFNADHGDHRETAVFVGTDGKLGFSCKHESCKGKHWRDFRRYYEPEKAAGDTRTTAVRQYALTNLADVQATPVAWVEENYLARGEMHFLQGQGGSYKGTLALTWASEFSRRGERVLLVLAEDDLAKKVKPALMAADANMSLVHPMSIHTGENEDALVLPDDMQQLEQAVVDTQAKLVVIDPILSHVSGKLDSYRDHDMKRVLTQISKLAQRTNTIIVCVHHTKKDTSGGMKLAGIGSVAFYTTARIVLAMAKTSEQEVVLETVKSNLGAEGARQLLRAEVVEVGPGIKVPRLIRAGESPVSVAEALSGERKEKESKSLAAARLMLDILEDEGEQEQNKLFDRVAEETGLKPGSVKRHAYFGILNEENLVESRKSAFRGPWMLARSDRERPANLQRAAAKSDNGLVTVRSLSRLGERECTSPSVQRTVTSSIYTQQHCHSSCVSPSVQRTVTSAPGDCHGSAKNDKLSPEKNARREASTAAQRAFETATRVGVPKDEAIAIYHCTFETALKKWFDDYKTHNPEETRSFEEVLTGTKDLARTC